MVINFKYQVIILFALLLCCSCSQKQQETHKEVRQVKVISIKKLPQTYAYAVSGITAPQQDSKLSFAVSGKINKINVSIGSKVVKGDLLATLDPVPYNLRLDVAKAARLRSEAVAEEQRQRFKAINNLYKKKYTSHISYVTAAAAYKTAQHNLSLASANLKLAEDNLHKTRLYAPFDGTIATKFVQEYIEITAGQPVVDLHSNEGFEVDVSLPDSVINEIKLQDKVRIKILSLRKDNIFNGIVENIGRHAASVNSYPVVIKMVGVSPLVRSGMPVKVIFRIPNEKDKSFIVPLTSLVSDKSSLENHIYLYNKENSRVTKIAAKIIAIMNNKAEISANLPPEGLLVIAGAQFITDGEKVSCIS